LTSGPDLIEFDTETEKWYTIPEVIPSRTNILLVSVDNRCMMIQSGRDIISFDPKEKLTKGRGLWFENYDKTVVGGACAFDQFLPQSIEYEGNVYWIGAKKQQTAKFNLADKTLKIVGSGEYRKIKGELTARWSPKLEWAPC